MTDWQSLISTAFTEQFLRTGRMLSFRLARGDLIDLSAQVMKRPVESVRAELGEGHAFSAIRCLVRCEPLDKTVVVDEWVRQG